MELVGKSFCVVYIAAIELTRICLNIHNSALGDVLCHEEMFETATEADSKSTKRVSTT